MEGVICVVSWCLLGLLKVNDLVSRVSLVIDPGAAGGAVGALFPPAAQLPWVSLLGKTTHLYPAPAPCTGIPVGDPSAGRVAHLLEGRQE